jgi:hypothetical protein
LWDHVFLKKKVERSIEWPLLVVMRSVFSVGHIYLWLFQKAYAEWSQDEQNKDQHDHDDCNLRLWVLCVLVFPEWI